MLDQPVLDRVEPAIPDMVPEILIAPDVMLPEPLLPDGGFVAAPTVAR